MNATHVSETRQKEAIERAKIAFARLPSGDRAFQQCVASNETIHGILGNIFQQNSRYKRKKSTKLLERFEAYTSWMNTISDSINIAVQSSAGIACPVWAPIKFVLIISRNHARAAQQILDVVEMIKENLPRLELYAQANNDGGFQAALLDLFTGIVEFSIHAYKFFGRGSFVRLFRLVNRSFQDEHGDLISCIERRTKAIDGLAIALAFERQDRLLRETQIMHHEDEARRKRVQIRDWLRAPNIQEFQNINMRLRTQSTCNWVLSHPEFRRWTDSSPDNTVDRVLIIHGPAGCGKSVLGSFLYDHMNESSRGKTATLLFSFAIGDAHRQTVDSLLRSLLSQLLEHDHATQLIPLLEHLQSTGPPPTSAFLEALQKGISSVSLPVIALIDGVDECLESEAFQRDDLIKWVQGLSMRTILLGRSHAFKSLSDCATISPSIAIDHSLNGEDISAFIHDEMANWDSISDEDSRGKIISALLEQADGMFLWVKLMILHLKSFKYAEARNKSLGDLPNGLEKAYSRILCSLISSLNNHQRQIVQTALSFAATSGRPLQMDEFQLAYALNEIPVNKPAPENIESFTLHIQAQELAELCGGLLICTGGNVRLLHSSTRDYLTRSEKHWRTTEDQSIWKFRIDSTKAHHALGEICLRYLSEIDYSGAPWSADPSPDTTNSQQPLLQYACFYIAYHFNRSGLSIMQIQERIGRLLESDQCCFALERITSYAFDGFSAALQFEILLLAQYAGQEFEGNSKIPSALFGRMDKEYALRVFRFGENDPRTVRWHQSHASASSILPNIDEKKKWQDLQQTSTVTFNNRFENAGHLNSENASTSPVAISTSSPGISRAINVPLSVRHRTHDAFFPFEGIRSLVQHSHSGVLGRQFELLVGLIQRSTMKQLVIDPLEALWQTIRQNSKSMPVILLAAISFYYHIMGKHEKSYQLGWICLNRLEDDQIGLKILVRHYMGHVASCLDHFEEAIDHFEFSLPQEENWFKATNSMTLHSRFVMAQCLWSMEKHEEAIIVLEEQSRRGFQHCTISISQKFSLYASLGYYQESYGRYEDARVTRKTLLKLYKTILQNADADKAYEESLSRLKLADVPHRSRQKNEINRAIREHFRKIPDCSLSHYGWFDWLNSQNDIFYFLLITTLTEETTTSIGKRFRIQINHERCNEFLKSEYNIFQRKGFSSKAKQTFIAILKLYHQVHQAEENKHSEMEDIDIVRLYYQARLYFLDQQDGEASNLLEQLITSCNKLPLGNAASQNRNLSILWLTLSELNIRRKQDFCAIKAARISRSLVSAVPNGFEDMAAISAVAHYAVKASESFAQEWIEKNNITQEYLEERLKMETEYELKRYPPFLDEMTIKKMSNVAERYIALHSLSLPWLLREEDFDFHNIQDNSDEEDWNHENLEEEEG